MTNTRASLNQAKNNQAKSSNMIAGYMEQLLKIIQGYEEKTSATLGMVAEMKIFEEKLKNLEKENSLLKEQVTKKDKT